jgi:hypothetical protein
MHLVLFKILKELHTAAVCDDCARITYAETFLIISCLTILLAQANIQFGNCLFISCKSYRIICPEKPFPFFEKIRHKK